MEKVTIKTLKQNRFGKTIIIANLKVKFDAKGESEIETGIAKTLCKNDPTLEIKGEKNSEKDLREKQIIWEGKNPEKVSLMEKYNTLTQGKILNPDLSLEEMREKIELFLIEEKKEDEIKEQERVKKETDESLELLKKEYEEIFEEKFPTGANIDLEKIKQDLAVKKASIRDTKTQLARSLAEKTVVELKEILEKSEKFEKSDWNSLNKNDLIAFITKNIDLTI